MCIQIKFTTTYQLSFTDRPLLFFNENNLKIIKIFAVSLINSRSGWLKF